MASPTDVTMQPARLGTALVSGRGCGAGTDAAIGRLGMEAALGIGAFLLSVRMSGRCPGGDVHRRETALPMQTADATRMNYC
jgi:hypothetical protein